MQAKENRKSLAFLQHRLFIWAHAFTCSPDVIYRVRNYSRAIHLDLQELVHKIYSLSMLCTVRCDSCVLNIPVYWSRLLYHHAALSSDCIKRVYLFKNCKPLL